MSTNCTQVFTWEKMSQKIFPPQNEAILKDLQKGKKITPLQALNDYGSFRLGARIWELKREGHKIDMQLITDRVTKKSWAEYSMAKNNPPIQANFNFD